MLMAVCELIADYKFKKKTKPNKIGKYMINAKLKLSTELLFIY